MNTTEQLLEACATWRRLTEAEAQGIRALDWSTVTQCQEAKVMLQPVLSDLGEALSQELAHGAVDTPQAALLVRNALAQLISLETANDALGAARRESLETQKAELALAHHNRDRVHRSSGGAPHSHSPSYP